MDPKNKSKPAAKVNVLLITADQLRGDAPGCYGNKVCCTPYIDALADKGVVFNKAFTPNPICIPARASITTGNYSHRATGIKNNGGLIRDGQPKLAEHFAANGYTTYACGKLHYVPYSAPGRPRLVHGFNHWDSCESGRIVQQYDPKYTSQGLEDYIDYLSSVGWQGYSRAHGIGNNDFRPCPSPLPPEHCVDHWVADRTIQRMKEHVGKSPQEPFLIWCSFPKPHAPLDPPADFAAKYDPREIDEPFGDESLLADRNPYTEYVRITHAYGFMSPQARHVAKAHYYGLVTFQDAQIGRIIRALEELGCAGNTVVVYCADHGDLMGDFGAFGKCSFQKGSVNVPIIIAGPGVPKGERRDQLAGLQDLLPTLASLSDCPLEAEVDGLDLTGVLKDERAALREVYYSQCLDGPRQMAMVTDGRWKYCYSQWGGVEELYDLTNDPNELANLAGKESCQSMVSEWRDVLICEASNLGDEGILDESSKTGLAEAELNRRELAELPIKGMGWRWY